MVFSHSLRFKIMLVTIIASVASILVILVITPHMVENRFIEQAKNRHFQNFTQALLEFKKSSENWNTREGAIKYYQSRFQPDRHNRRQIAPKRPPAHLRGLDSGRPDFSSPLASDNLRFVLTNPAGFVVLPFYHYQAGQLINQNELSEAEPLVHRGELLGYALASGDIKLSEKDNTYLQTLTDSLLISALIAVLFASSIGYLLTRSIQTRLKRLIRATQNLADNPNPSDLKMPGKDEISLLANQFDQMSARLTDQFNELENSHQIISEQARSLEKLSYTDELTELANRRYFNDAFETLLKEARVAHTDLSLILCDIDHFKKVNDEYSHQIGDQVLKQVAQILQSSIREDDIAARIGGEELVILMPKTDKQTALQAAGRIRNNIETYPWHKIALGLTITMSSGVASLNDEAAQVSCNILFKRADARLYTAKSAGRNQVCG